MTAETRDHLAAVRRILINELQACGVEPCADGSCIFGPPPGQRTNGGCQCLKRLPPGTPREARILIQRIAKAARALAGLSDPAMIAHFAKEIADAR